MASFLSSLACLTGVLSLSILSTHISSMHRMICPATKCQSMKYPYPRQPTAPLSENPVSASVWHVSLMTKTYGLLSLIIVSPDESRGYLGFSTVTPPLSQRFPFGRDTLKNILVRTFKFGMWVYMGNATNTVVLWPWPSISRSLVASWRSDFGHFFTFWPSSPIQKVGSSYGWYI